ncbi:MAG: 3-polyprenyl-4-hydroxybenzoate decarboxylase-like protein [Solidesulfovibrio magneticus str. Maddingley MBC34]|uniref:3-polyprenyl-4-hydroxybenzoate decarboxylase-like protein n=1 Tax=Solidesulfovibrio magneticus str. Maddingley MBC34 TaxID=1206767 RepID=K6GVR4_9BACT|nr:MAG: 3-polyprenyl-4-hydroxybenzoate decarboxylase-like protein [Solidesulfovibrio magneticus str. Maddingley MBC34]
MQKGFPRQYDDLNAHLEKLDKAGLLWTINDPINKDRHLHPFVRWGYVGDVGTVVANNPKRAFLFTNVTDSKGHSYQGDCDVMVGGTAGSPAIYAASLGIDDAGDDLTALSQKIFAKWVQAFEKPIPAVEIPSEEAPVHEVVITGDALKGGEGKGLAALPVPNNTPGWDTAPYFSAGLWITKDLDTGVENISQNRCSLKASDRMTAMWLIQTNGGAHNNWVKYKERGEKMPVALIVGAPPMLQVIGPQKTPEHLNDLDVAGGLAGVPYRKVACKTVPLMAPADAQIIIEGWIDPTKLEMEAPFGESYGNMSVEEYNHSIEVTAITRRKKAVITSMISQMAPSESGVIKQLNYSAVMLNHLKNTLYVRQVKDVALHGPMIGVSRLTVIVLEKNTPRTEVWRALTGASAFMRSVGKITVAVDEDINPNNVEEVLWAIAYRTDLMKSVKIEDYQANGHAPKLRDREWEAKIMIDATMHYAMPPVALPTKEIMEEARELWEKAGLPKIAPRWKWYGYSLGDWCEEWTKCADRAVAGDWLLNGIRTAVLVDTDAVGGPTAGVPRKGVVRYNEQTGQVEYPEGFPLRDKFNTDE